MSRLGKENGIRTSFDYVRRGMDAAYDGTLLCSEQFDALCFLAQSCSLDADVYLPMGTIRCFFIEYGAPVSFLTRNLEVFDSTSPMLSYLSQHSAAEHKIFTPSPSHAP